jgi:hypothetical protein
LTSTLIQTYFWIVCIATKVGQARFLKQEITLEIKLLHNYIVKDVFVSNALAQFAMNRTNASEARHITLNGLQNMMVVNDSRPKPLLCK